jgi:hypothetical protein
MPERKVGNGTNRVGQQTKKLFDNEGGWRQKGKRPLGKEIQHSVGKGNPTALRGVARRCDKACYCSRTRFFVAMANAINSLADADAHLLVGQEKCW